MEQQNIMPQSIADNLPAMVKNELFKFSAQKQEEFIEEYKRKAKPAGIVYLFWAILGCHYLYFKKWEIQIFFWLTSGGLLIWWVVDLFRIPGMIRDFNKDVAVDVLRDLKVISS